MDRIINIQNINPDNLQLQNYNIEDESLITNYIQQDIIFNPFEDYVEYFILDLNNNILFKNEAGYPNYKLRDNLITIDPQKDLELHGYTEGQYYTIYNFLKRKLSSSVGSTFYIQDISSDRTELRLNTTTINNTDVTDLTTQFANQISLATGSYLDFYLNFGNNQLIIANNIALDNTNIGDPTVLIKLYEPLPQNFTFNSQCWIVEQVAESKTYQIELTTVFNVEEQLDYISGPNFNLDIQDQINNSTPYYNQNTLNLNNSGLGSGSLLYQINSLLVEKGIEINIDYSDYSQFINFSSAQTRLENFYYKLSLIEQYSINAGYSNGPLPLNTFTSGSQFIWQNKINDIITNFDGYEYYLYYESGSYAWPKSNSLPPYNNLSTTNPIALTWLNTQLSIAENFDSENNNSLIRTIPEYLKEDDNNSQYFLFTQMLGQHFDNIWIYLKDITNKFDADNRLNYGISKDIVAQAIRDLGVKIYQNNFSSNDLYSALLGITPSGSLFNVPNITSALPTPTGLEYVNTYISASAPESLEPVDDINKETYKKIYHNLPLLLKKKGTAEGLRLLINTYGIPDTILRINEFGGKSNQLQAWDNFVDQFNYALNLNSQGYFYTSYDAFGVSPYNLTPDTIFFRFKPAPPLSPTSNFSQVLFTTPNTTPSNIVSIILTYSGSNSGSYSGSIAPLDNIYGTLSFYNYNGVWNSCSISLPFFNGDWWSVALTTDSNLTNYLYTANNPYNGYDGSQIGFFASSSESSVSWKANLNYGNLLYLSTDQGVAIIDSITCLPYSGAFQEFRLYNSYQSINPERFKDYVMNPYSIEGLTLTGSFSSFNTLYFRAPLGADLNTTPGILTPISIHPAISQYPPTQSFYNGGSPNSLYGVSYTTGEGFFPNTEVIYQDQFDAGVKNSVAEKIRIVNTTVPPGDTLSPYISIQQHSYTGENFTKDVNYVEAAFSPQDEINDDIIAQLGSFNVGNYIGDPRDIINSPLTYYPDFNKLRDYYFSKYTHSYDLNDYIRLIKFFDNSLFKMIKDFTPARAGLASGIVIKSTLLERQRYPQPPVTINSNSITFVGSPTTRTLNIPL